MGSGQARKGRAKSATKTGRGSPNLAIRKTRKVLPSLRDSGASRGNLRSTHSRTKGRSLPKGGVGRSSPRRGSPDRHVGRKRPSAKRRRKLGRVKLHLHAKRLSKRERARRDALYRLQVHSINRDEFIEMMEDLDLNPYDELADYGRAAY